MRQERSSGKVSPEAVNPALMIFEDMLQYEPISTRKVLIKLVVISHVLSDCFNWDKSNLNTC